MSHRIYTPEFKDEAVRQVVDRGDTVKEVAEVRVACGGRTLKCFAREALGDKLIRL
jgi:Transposase